MHWTAFLDFALRILQDGGNAIPAAWSTFSRPAAALALTAVWQGAAVALGLSLCLRLAPRSPARHRFALWAAGFGAIIGLQLLPLVFRLFPARLVTAGGFVAPIGTATAFHPWLQLGAAWGLAIAALWLAASLCRAVDLAVHSLQLRKLWKTAVPVEIDPASLPRSLGRLARPAVQICTTSRLERPSVIGFFAPRILIPDWLFLRLTSGELDQIVLHETEHLRRRDDWTNLLQKLCLVLFPLNPGLAWIERRLCREREMACDDGVIGITRAPRAYAACLASLAERGLERRAGALSLGAWHARPELVRRVHSILRRKHALSPLAARAVLGAVGCVLLGGAAALARCPRLVAFQPAQSATVAHISPVVPLTAEDGSDSVWKAQDSSAQDSTALKGQESSTDQVAALKTPARITGNRADLKGHDFSRAGNDAKASRALAPEGNTLEASSPRRAAPSPTPRLASDSARSSAFIVMSTWESFEVTAPENCREGTETKAAGCNESVRVAGPESALTAQRITPRITVTRMYLKIYSTGDKGSTWLVIQL